MMRLLREWVDLSLVLVTFGVTLLEGCHQEPWPEARWPVPFIAGWKDCENAASHTRFRAEQKA